MSEEKLNLVDRMGFGVTTGFVSVVFVPTLVYFPLKCTRHIPNYVGNLVKFFFAQSIGIDSVVRNLLEKNPDFYRQLHDKLKPKYLEIVKNSDWYKTNYKSIPL
nr:hypothetical protein [Nanoarchaeota archaeon]